MSSKLVIGIPTVGRAAVLCESLREISRQTRPPDGIIVCGARETDLQGVAQAAPAASALLTQPGLPRQRNAIIDAAGDADILVFFDDDFFPHADYLRVIEHCMIAHPSCTVATGAVLADGINGPGLSPAEGRAILARTPLSVAANLDVVAVPIFTGYGCNMAVRLAPVREHGLRFDERLPLYGWQEDVDFSRRLAAFGQVMHVEAARGVHLGVKSGRASGVRLGYSQIANPLYLTRKDCGYPLGRALVHIARNVAMNLVRSTWPEPYVDRRGRLQGNVLAARDLLLSRMSPERVLEL